MPIHRDRSPLPSPVLGSPPRSVRPRGSLTTLRQRLLSAARPHRAVALIALIAGVASRTAAYGQAPRPLDPLTPQETRAAQELAQADARVRDLVGTRRHAVGPIDFLALKPDTAGPPEPRPVRAALVHFYVYEGDYGVRALVDLTRRAVMQVERLDRQPIPFSPQEIAEARRIGLADERVRRALGPRLNEYRLQWLGVRPTNSADPCFQHRCVLLVPRRGTRYLLRPKFVVDLTDRVVRVSEQ